LSWLNFRTKLMFILPANVDQENQATVAGRARVVRVEEQGSGAGKAGVAVAIESFNITRSG
jgi:hypothetical protein